MKVAKNHSTQAETTCEPHPTRLAHGRAMVLQSTAIGIEKLRILSPSGEVELAITIGPNGPTLTVRSVDIEIAAEHRLSMSCRELEVNVRGAATIDAGESMRLSARDVYVEAPEGEIGLRANDDVDVRGERIRLNCDDPPMPTSWTDFSARVLDK